MKQHFPKNKINHLLFSGIGRTLVVSFLVFAIIPMLFIGIISYKKAYISLRKETEVALKIVATLKMREVTAYFKDMTVALQNQAETEESTGLGLSISLTFAEMLGGYIHFSSREGKGSSFILCIPEVIEKESVDLPEDKKEMFEFIHDKKNLLKNKKILIVDDDMRNVFVMINIFEKKGIKTIVAGSGKDFLIKLKENPDIDLVFMDIVILEQDGQIAIKEIREMDAEFSKVPVIALTENDVDGDCIKYIKIGASDYLTKPVDIEKLLLKLMFAC